MKVLLFKNYPSSSPSDYLFIDSFSENIRRSCPEASLDVCCIANGDAIPDLSEYGLVILSGGRVNLLESEKPAWAIQVLDMIRTMSSAEDGPKLLGICWGHQAIHYALGGRLEWLEERPRVSTMITPLSTDNIGGRSSSHCSDWRPRSTIECRRTGAVSTGDTGKSDLQ